MVIFRLVKSLGKWLFLYAILLLTSTGALAFQSQKDEAHPFGIYYDDETAIEFKDGRGSVEFLFEIPDKYYLYKDSVRVESNDPAIIVELTKPAGKVKHDEFIGKVTEVYYRELAVTATFTVPQGFSGDKITGTLLYQGCSTSICYRTMTVDFTLPVKSSGSLAVVPPMAGAQSPPANQSGSFWELLKARDFNLILARGLPLALLVTFIGGLLTSLTGCVLPVIPLTLAFMGVTPEKRAFDKVKALGVFEIGMVGLYASLGVVATLFGKTFGFWFQSLSFQIFLVAFFAIMGLWMLGVFHFALPSRIQTALVQYQPQGYRRDFYAGLTLGFLAAPCVGPTAGPLLVWVSQTKDAFMGFILMASYAVGLSVLFIVLTFFSSDWVRRFGNKSNFVKKFVGITLLAVSGFYLTVVVQPFTAQADSFFIKSYPQAVEVAQKEGKGVLVDFYAKWCAPCLEWDKEVWSDPQAQAAIKSKFVPVKIDCTNMDKECKAVVEEFGVIGWPTILFLNKKASEIPDKRLVGQVMDVDEFLSYLKDLAP